MLVDEAPLQRLLEEGPLSLEVVMFQLYGLLLSWMRERHVLLDARLRGRAQTAQAALVRPIFRRAMGLRYVPLQLEPRACYKCQS